MREDARSPALGDPAPSPELVDLRGLATPLSTAWAEGPAVIVFLRYFGCPFCQAFVARLRTSADRFREAGASITLVGQGTPGGASAFTGPHRVPFPILVDLNGAAYHAYGLTDGTLAQAIDPRVWAPWIKANLSSETRQGGLQGGSFSQQPGTFIVDGLGLVRYVHRNGHAADDPDSSELLRAVAAVDAT